MIKKTTLGALCTFFSLTASAQCDSITIPNDYTLSSDLIMSGTYVVNGTFTVQSGVTVFVTSHETNGCGELKIYADNIVIDGMIDGNYAGFTGGTGGAKGTAVTSGTGHSLSLTDCNDPDTQGNITLQAGVAGTNGTGPGNGNAGANGANGSGPKQWCGNTQDEAGVIGGGGGAGGGAGGSYGGQGSVGAAGGTGSSATTTDNLPIEGSYAIVGGAGGNGGLPTTAYGTATDRDIAIGSGGAGAGGGGRSYTQGTAGGAGGSGGGMVFLKGNVSVSVTGTITVKGEVGANGGNGGSGDATADCCSDGCNGCDERTFSTGAGSGSGSGGGSGGGIFIESLGVATISGTLDASGGNGGNGGTAGNGVLCEYSDFFCGDQSINTGNGTAGQKGGAGGGGRIKIYVADCDDANITATPVVNGGTGFVVGGLGSYEEVCGYVGLEEGEISVGWSVFPNPANDIVNVNIYSGVDFGQDCSLEIYNTLGQKIYENSSVESEMSIDVSSFKSGMYTVRILTSNRTEFKKIMKQ